MVFVTFTSLYLFWRMFRKGVMSYPNRLKSSQKMFSIFSRMCGLTLLSMAS